MPPRFGQRMAVTMAITASFQGGFVSGKHLTLSWPYIVSRGPLDLAYPDAIITKYRVAADGAVSAF